MTAFDDVRLPEDVERGAVVGPVFQTSISTLSAGGEQRNADWVQERLTADISYGMMRHEDPRDIENSFLRVLAFYRARRGRWRSFRFKDWADYIVRDEQLVLLEPTVAQVYKIYDDYRRKITRPVAGTLQVFGPNGQPLTIGTHFFPEELGKIRFAQPIANPAGYSVSCEFDVPMRFDSDMMSVALEHAQAGSIPTIKLMQVRE